MKSSALFCLAALSCLPSPDVRADDTVETTVTAETEKALLTPAQIDDLLAPIALYPDPLIALILPATTFPTDIVLAARYLKAGKAPEDVENQPWDDSVKALARYPEVVKWLDENLAWTQQLGAAFLVQPAAVMNGTQRLRKAAIAAGNLKDTPEQKVVVEREVVRIVPAEREVIYVPVYDPIYVYRPRVVEVVDVCPPPLVTFSIGYRTGFWLSYYCNWGVNTVVIVNRPYRSTVWYSHPVWSCPSPTVVVHNHVWRPAPVRVQAVCRDFERHPAHPVVRPGANLYVQRGPDRPASPGFGRSNNAEARPGRPESGGNASREVASTTPATPVAPATDTNRRDHDDRRDRPAASDERARIETTPAARRSGELAQNGRQSGGWRSSGTANATRIDGAGSASSAPAVQITDQARPTPAPAVAANPDSPAPSPAPRVDRRGTRADTVSTTVPGSPAPASGFGRNQGQTSRRSSITPAPAPSQTQVVVNDAPAAPRTQPVAGSSRRSDSRMGNVPGSPSPAPAASSGSGFGQRRPAGTDVARSAPASPEAPSSGRGSRQTQVTDGTTSPLVADLDSDSTRTRSRR